MQHRLATELTSSTACGLKRASHRLIMSALIIGLVVPLALLSMPAAQASSSVSFNNEWRTQGFPFFSRNRYQLQGSQVGIRSDDSVSLLYKVLPETQWDAMSASWSWSVAQSVIGTDLTIKGGDDRNIALYFIFMDREDAEALRGRSIRSALRKDSLTALVYVWGGDHRRGSILNSPYLQGKGKTVVLRSAGTGNASENINLAADHRRAFGREPQVLVGLALSADSDDTDGEVQANVSNLRLR